MAKVLRNFNFVARSMSFSRQIKPPLLLTSRQLDAFSRQQKISLLDASWFMPNSPRNPSREYLSKRIPGAQFLDLDDVASKHLLGLKHMMPSERVFAEACEKFGIEPSTHVVIYDTAGIFSSPRALFMFRSFGHHNSSVLDGGLPAWVANGFPVQSGPVPPVPRVQYPAPELDTTSLRSYEQIVSNSLLDPAENPSAHLVLDARAYGRFSGAEPEPRPGLSSGHIPNSFSLPFNLFLQKQTGADGTEYTTFRPLEDIREALDKAVGVNQAQKIINNESLVTTSCGSGMTAGILWLGLKLLGTRDVSLYDESWTGYAMRDTSKIDKSP